MDYIIVPTSNSDYQSWQCRLLNWSRKKVKQPGKLIFLRCADEMGNNRPLDVYTDTDVEVIDLPDYALEWEHAEEEAKRGEKYWWGAIPNKYMSIKWLCDNNHFQDDDTLLFLDPDMIFLELITYKPTDNEVIAQRFIHYVPMEDWTALPNEEYGKGIMYPFCMKFKTVKTIMQDYKTASEEIRRKTKRWEAEMWGLDYAVKKNNLHIQYREDFGCCTVWKENNSTEVSQIIHFPNVITDETYNTTLFFKQDYTFNQAIPISAHSARNKIEELLLMNVTQERTDYLYHLKWNFKNLFINYDGTDGYLILKPWPGGFNNIRMSLELAVCISYLTNKTLVLPPKYNMYLLKDQMGLEDFFDIDDIGIKFMQFDEFCQIKNIDNTFDAVKLISKVITEPDGHVLNFSKSRPNEKFTKHRPITNMLELIGTDECLFFDGKLLGNFYQTIYTHLDVELKQLIAKHVHYTNEIFDLGWKGVEWLGNQQYYAIHIRRNDFQYKDLFISAEQIYENIKDIVPENSVLYIATDENDKSFFDVLAAHYKLYFYEDVSNGAHINAHYNFIPIIEQLICSRAIKFVGNDYSTLSSYVYRLRGYMNDIDDKNFYVNTSVYNQEAQCDFIDTKNFIANWAREFKDVWDMKQNTILVSIASYRDTQLIPTLHNLYKNAQDISRITVGVHLQDTEEYYNKLLAENFPNIKIIFTPHEESLGVVWAREKIKNELITDEQYFFQIDAHSRFKKHWDGILIHQHKSMPHNRVVISTYPNGFELDDIELKYPTNAPLVIREFFSEAPTDNRLHTRNLAALDDYDVVDTKWIGAGFIFAPVEWVREIKVPTTMLCKGEEDYQTFSSYLHGWDIKLPAETVIWHNYNAHNPDNTRYREINHNNLQQDHSIEVINDVLFNTGNSYTRSLKKLEEFLSIKFKQTEEKEDQSNRTNSLHRPIEMHDTKKIFVAIASHLDLELRNTILDCINKAKHPENLVFSICLQYDEKEGTNESAIDDLVSQYNIQIKKYHYSIGQGGCWARQIAQQAYNGEHYSLQIDSHLRFIQNWDELIINDYEDLKSRGIRKPLLSYCSPSYIRDDEKGVDVYFQHETELDKIDIVKIRNIVSELWVEYGGYQNELNTGFKNVGVPLLYGGFVFTQGSWVVDVEQDPEHYYTGEELALSIRSFTHGYDIFTPKQIITWHRSGDPGLCPKHWQVHGSSVGNQKHAHAMKRLNSLIFGGDLGKYGKGTTRSIREFMGFSGIDFVNLKISERNFLPRSNI